MDPGQNIVTEIIGLRVEMKADSATGSSRVDAQGADVSSSLCSRADGRGLSLGECQPGCGSIGVTRANRSYGRDGQIPFSARVYNAQPSGGVLFLVGNMTSSPPSNLLRTTGNTLKGSITITPRNHGRLRHAHSSSLVAIGRFDCPISH